MNSDTFLVMANGKPYLLFKNIVSIPGATEASNPGERRLALNLDEVNTNETVNEILHRALSMERCLDIEELDWKSIEDVVVLCLIAVAKTLPMTPEQINLIYFKDYSLSSEDYPDYSEEYSDY